MAKTHTISNRDAVRACRALGLSFGDTMATLKYAREVRYSLGELARECIRDGAWEYAFLARTAHLEPK